jgi:hypothetical protein
VARSFDPPIRPGERIGLSLLVALTWACAVGLLFQIQSDAGRYRQKLEKMILNEKLLSQEEREQIGFEPYVNPALRGWKFLAALIGVVSIGAGLVVYSFLLR